MKSPNLNVSFITSKTNRIKSNNECWSLDRNNIKVEFISPILDFRSLHESKHRALAENHLNIALSGPLVLTL